MKDSVPATVDKAAFLEFGRVFRRVYRSARAAKVVLTLADGRLRIEFAGGKCELQYEPQETRLIAEVSAKSFAGIVTAHRSEKCPSGTIRLTFRPELGEFATPLAGAQARFL